jgi:hypothetical protein
MFRIRKATPALVCGYDGRRPEHVVYSINLDDVLKALKEAQNPVVLPPKKSATGRRVQTQRGSVLKSIKNAVDGVVKRRTKRCVVEKRAPIGLGIENIPIC